PDPDPTPTPSGVYDTFDGSGGLDPAKWDTYNAADPSRLEITQNGGRYYADLKGDADPQQTLWYNGNEGRMDYQTFTGDFEFIVRNIGLDSFSGSSWEYQLCGLSVWQSPLNYEFAVIGNRGETYSTLEYKITNAGSSTQNDIGANSFPTGKGDLRVVRSGSNVDFYYKQPSASSWTLIDHDSLFANRINFGTGAVRVGLITYGFSYPDPFICTADQVEIPTGTPT
ncbi:MAG TPA: hypothetical protein PKA32_02480, partial [Candidatus Gracilibacteria bacterium]|nr:hypothetical protein [Candidatus Gracilibacteria bacterium]